MTSGNMFCVFGIVGYVLGIVSSASIDPEILINACSLNPCVHGSCIPGELSYQCTCDPGYTGKDCETDIQECTSNICENGGTCTKGVESDTCQCAPGFTGIQCQDVINACSSNPCLHGLCIPGELSYKCVCAPGYIGTDCETDIGECASNTEFCENGGECYIGIDSAICQCVPGFTGIQCQYDIDECELDICSPLNCENSFGSYSCS